MCVCVCMFECVCLSVCVCMCVFEYVCGVCLCVCMCVCIQNACWYYVHVLVTYTCTLFVHVMKRGSHDYLEVRILSCGHNLGHSSFFLVFH